MKLGKLPPRLDPRTLKLGKYIASLPAPPTTVDWLSGITDWKMMTNDVLGSCTCAALGHARQVWTAATGPEYTPSDDAVLMLYEQACGYNPADPSTDRGGVELDVLNYVRKNGLFGDTLMAFVDPDPGNEDHIRQAIYLFGCVYIGLALPLSAESQVGGLWDDVGDFAGGWGGHAVVVPAYDADTLTCITWGKRQKMTWNFWAAYCDEAHCLLSQEWHDYAEKDYAFLGNLEADLAEVTG